MHSSEVGSPNTGMRGSFQEKEKRIQDPGSELMLAQWEFFTNFLMPLT